VDSISELLSGCERLKERTTIIMNWAQRRPLPTVPQQERELMSGRDRRRGARTGESERRMGRRRRSVGEHENASNPDRRPGNEASQRGLARKPPTLCKRACPPRRRKHCPAAAGPWRQCQCNGAGVLARPAHAQRLLCH